jgi:hypothetical protein
MEIISFVPLSMQVEPAIGLNRDGKWPPLAKAWLEAHPECVCCGRKGKDNVPHHVLPVHAYPELELVMSNYGHTVCPKCHITVGHGGNFKTWNTHFEATAKSLRTGIVSARPKATAASFSAARTSGIASLTAARSLPTLPTRQYRYTRIARPSIRIRARIRIEWPQISGSQVRGH